MQIHNNDNGADPDPSSFLGYWVECVPLRPRSWLHLDPGLYAASVDGLPDVKAIGLSPDRAISKVKRRLEALRQERVALGQTLPPAHNHLSPPQRLRAEVGWMSVYVALQQNQAT